jgi:hypothetical protein
MALFMLAASLLVPPARQERTGSTWPLTSCRTFSRSLSCQHVSSTLRDNVASKIKKTRNQQFGPENPLPLSENDIFPL